MADKHYKTTPFSPVQRLRRGEFFVCQICNKEFYVFPSRVRQAEKQGAAIRYCSKECYSVGKRGEGNPMWGKKLSPEAVEKMMSHPNRRAFDSSRDNPNHRHHGEKPHKASSSARWRKYLSAKRGAACERCGYNAYPQILEIHHIDCDYRNNVEENLQLICPNCHAETHFLNKTGGFAPKRTKKYEKSRPGSRRPHNLPPPPKAEPSSG